MAVVTFTMHRTPVTLLGIHSKYAGLEPTRVTPHAANDNLTQLTGHARPCLMANSSIHSQHANWLLVFWHPAGGVLGLNDWPFLVSL